MRSRCFEGGYVSSENATSASVPKATDSNATSAAGESLPAALRCYKIYPLCQVSDLSAGFLVELDQVLLHVIGHLLIAGGLHGEVARAARDRAQAGSRNP